MPAGRLKASYSYGDSRNIILNAFLNTLFNTSKPGEGPEKSIFQGIDKRQEVVYDTVTRRVAPV